MPEERWQEYLKTVYGDKLTEKDVEKMFLYNPADTFAIYQLRHHESKHDHCFLSMSQLQATGLTVERSNCEAVHTGDLHYATGKAIPEMLNDIFYRFNVEHPEDFHCHSLSVSDIVVLKVDNVVSVHYVDRYGWQELQGLFPDQPMRNAEMELEDNYGMIDGIINNGKREPAHKLPSVTEQLRKQPVHSAKMSKKRKVSIHLNSLIVFSTH